MEDPPPRPDPHRPEPVRLDYFAAAGPDSRRARRVTIWSLALAAGWLPYACGVLNAVVAAQSHSGPIVRSHTFGTTVFMGTGLVLSLAALVGFARLRHGTGVLAAAATVLVQGAVAGCLGAARL